MKIEVSLADITKAKVDLLVINEFEGVREPSGATATANKALGGLIYDLAAAEHFEGKEGQVLLFHAHGKIPAARVAVLGLGKRDEFSLDTVRRLGAVLIRKARDVGAKSVGTILHGAGVGGLEPTEAARSLAEGIHLGAYRFLRYRGEEAKKAAEREVKEVKIIIREKGKAAAVRAGIAQGELIAEGVTFARDLVNEPAAKMKPGDLAEVGRELRGNGISVELFDEEQLRQMGTGAFLGVAQGSDEPPFLVHLIYQPKHLTKKRPKVAIVGKAITFDTGGLSLKPAEAMETMKLDMAGAAAILGLFKILPRLAPAIEVHGIFAACENMPSGKALRPGDILHSLAGKTIEVTNTDAEGRLTLADALTLAVRLKPDAIVDLATLTGACMVALGQEVAGLMGNNERLVAAIKESAKRAGEKVWELPLVKEYKEEYLKSEVADLRNAPKSRYGGAIAAGLFLAEFVGDTSWVHLDIAGPAWAERETPLCPKGGTGFGVATLAEWLTSLPSRP